MFKDKLPGDRFFARIGRELDCECPRCGLVYHGHAAKAQPKSAAAHGWNARTQRFQCTSCSLVLGFGVLAWPLTRHGVGIPRDALPDFRQALQLRQQAGGLWLPDAARQSARTDRNVVLVEGCTCTTSTLGTWVNPGCRVHGHGEER